MKILSETAQIVQTLAQTGNWTVLLALAPCAIAFGADHPLTAGHSTTVLAFWLAGTGARRGVALRSAFDLSAMQIGVSMLIVLVALPVGTMAHGEAGHAVRLLRRRTIFRLCNSTPRQSVGGRAGGGVTDSIAQHSRHQ